MTLFPPLVLPLPPVLSLPRRRRRGSRHLRRLCRLAALAFSALLLAGVTSAQDLAPAVPPDRTVDVGVLNLRLLPLTKDALLIEAEAWRQLLETQVTTLTARQIAVRQSTDAAEQERLLRELSPLLEERRAIVERMQVVIDHLLAKGGDAEPFLRYTQAVTRTTLEIEDVSGLWLSVRQWATSNDGGIRWLFNFAKAFGVLIVFLVLAAIAGGIARRAVGRLRGTSMLLREFFVNTVRKSTLFIGAIVALAMLEVPIGPFLAAIGAAGLIIGLALQGTLSNFASGIMILLYRPYDTGNWVTVAGVSGRVTAMNLVSTTILTADNQVMVIPNNSIWGNVITNVTGSDTRRVDLVFAIGYDDDIDKAIRVLEEEVSRHPKVLPDPAPLIRCHELADSCVKFVVRPWSKTSDYWDVYWDLTKTVKQRFDAEGITIPFPQREVHLRGSFGGQDGSPPPELTAAPRGARDGDSDGGSQTGLGAGAAMPGG